MNRISFINHRIFFVCAPPRSFIGKRRLMSIILDLTHIITIITVCMLAHVRNSEQIHSITILLIILLDIQHFHIIVDIEQLDRICIVLYRVSQVVLLLLWLIDCSSSENKHRYVLHISTTTSYERILQRSKRSTYGRCLVGAGIGIGRRPLKEN